MQLETDTFSLALEGRQFELRKLETSNDEETWVHTKRGDASSAKLLLRTSSQFVNVYLNGLDIGRIAKYDTPALTKLNELVTDWIKNVGPVDNQTARIAELMVNRQRLTKLTPVTVQALTWNVNGMLAQADSSTWELLNPNEDIVVLGFQETDQLSRNFTSNALTLQTTLNNIAEHLPDHKMIVQNQLLGLMSVVYIKQSLVPYVSQISTLTSGTGFLRMWGNKGAVLIRFSLFRDSIMGGGTEFSIVNCHLSAGEGMSQVGRRRWELREIAQRFSIPFLSLNNVEHEFDTAAQEYAELDLEDEEIPGRYRQARELHHEADSVPHARVGSNTVPQPEVKSSSASRAEAESDNKTEVDPEVNPKSKSGSMQTQKPEGNGKTGKRKKGKKGKINNVKPEPVEVEPSQDPRDFEESKESKSNEKESKGSKVSKESNESKTKEAEDPENAENDTRDSDRSSPDSQKHVRFSGILEYDGVDETGSSGDSDYQDQVTIVLGDLNYRTLLEADESRKLIQSRQYDAVLEHDSLRREMKMGHVLKDFEEGTINFPPTFKYGNDSNQYVVRVPSYTDRILYRSTNKVEVKSYQSFDVRISDHRPVAGEYEIAASGFDFEERGQILDKVLRAVDHAENTSQPRLEVSTQVIDVKGPVLSTVSAWVTLTSRSNRAIRWTVQHGNKIKVTPPNGILLKNSNKQKILVKAALRVETHSISDVLVFKPNGGADVFVSVDFTALPSCLGSTLEEMCCMPKGARNERSEEPTTNLPKQIWSCINYLWTRVDPEMFAEPGEPSVIQQVLEWLDTGVELDEQVLDTANSTANGAGVRAVSSILMLLFQYLPVAPIPLNHVPPSARGLAILEHVPSVAANVIIYLLGFVRHGFDFGLTRDAALDILDPMLMGPGDDQLSRRREIVKSLLN